MKYHKNIRDQQCTECEMAFHEYKTLKNHLWKIHGIHMKPIPKKVPEDDTAVVKSAMMRKSGVLNKSSVRFLNAKAKKICRVSLHF